MVLFLLSIIIIYYCLWLASIISIYYCYSDCQLFSDCSTKTLFFIYWLPVIPSTKTLSLLRRAPTSGFLECPTSQKHPKHCSCVRLPFQLAQEDQTLSSVHIRIVSWLWDLIIFFIIFSFSCRAGYFRRFSSHILGLVHWAQATWTSWLSAYCTMILLPWKIYQTWRVYL